MGVIRKVVQTLILLFRSPMQDVQSHFRIRGPIVVGVFFIMFFIIGLAIFRDYGVYNDEYINNGFGSRWVKYVSAVFQARSLSVPLPEEMYVHDYIHGPIFEIFSSALRDFFRVSNSRDVILVRHLIVFLMFYIGVGFFYFLCWRHFRNLPLALLGCVFLVLCPRVFADAFYNSTDISFLSFFIIGLFTLIVMLDKRTFFSALVHACVCAILIDIRLVGLFLTILTVGFFCLKTMRARQTRDMIKDLWVIAAHLFFLIILVVLFNPFLWAHPFMNFKTSLFTIQQLHAKDLPAMIYYLGAYYKYGEMPWHYLPVWVLVSTPFMYLSFFFVGIFASIRLLLNSGYGFYWKQRNTVIFLLSFFVPLVMATGKAHNGWRHIYFIYPVLIILALIGVQYFWRNIGPLINIRPLIRGVLVVGISLFLVDTAAFMIRNHPYQNIYFNFLAGRDPAEIMKRFDLDYFGLSYRKAFEYVLKFDGGATVPSCFSAKYQGTISRKILALKERARLTRVSREKAKYFFVTRMTVLPRPGEDKFYEINVDGITIMRVYKLDHGVEKK